MNSDIQWFGVKTFYRSVAQGPPQGVDDLYQEDVSLVEERLVLVRARSFDEAIEIAEREAEEYATGSKIRNPYGQPVVTRYLGTCDAYDMSPDEPEAGVEVYSAMEVVPLSISDEDIVARAIGQRERNRDILCRNLGDICFQKAAPGVERTAEEKAFVKRGLEFARKPKPDA